MMPATRSRGSVVLVLLLPACMAVPNSQRRGTSGAPQPGSNSTGNANASTPIDPAPPNLNDIDPPLPPPTGNANASTPVDPNPPNVNDIDPPEPPTPPPAPPTTPPPSSNVNRNATNANASEGSAPADGPPRVGGASAGMCGVGMVSGLALGVFGWAALGLGRLRDRHLRRT